MLKVERTIYKNRTPHFVQEEYGSLRELADFVFDHAGFTVCDDPKPDVSFSEAMIRFRKKTNRRMPDPCFIRTIRNDKGAYLYSDGLMTGGKRICSEGIKRWMKVNVERRESWSFDTAGDFFSVADLLTDSEKTRVQEQLNEEDDLIGIKEAVDTLIYSKILPEMKDEEISKLAEKALPRFEKYRDENDAYWDMKWQMLTEAVEHQYKEDAANEI